MAKSEQRKESKDWVLAAKEARKEHFSELDVLLRAVERFFNIENIPSTKENLAESNFFDELSAVRDIILRTLSVLEVIIPENKRNAYWFQKFAETKFLTDRKRDMLREELYRQDTAEKGLLLLYDSFTNVKTLAADLLKTGNIPYLSYLNIGQILSKEIRENNYFNPFRKDIDPEFDIIYNQEVSDIVKGITDRETKKHISLVIIYLFRFLRYLNCIDITTQRTISLNTSLIILMLIRSEIKIFSSYVKKITDNIAQPDMKEMLQSLSYQFSMETKRVYQQELKDILRKKAPGFFRGRIENSKGILKNLTEQSIIQIANFYKPGLKGEDIFPSFTTRIEQSLKLREDICALHKFLILIQGASESTEKTGQLFESLKNIMLYFESFTFKLLRYGDYEEFVSFFKELLSFKRERIIEQDFNKFMEKIHNFRIFLETTLRQIAGRTELQDRPVDMSRVDKIMKQYF
ncbi:MAG: hypothetical protein COZ31_09275 [Nitrospirae bacterium CG_4_10_14_3_um_filter_44_29]|nr:hypothetical protein [Nitrospirota bacterium]PIP70355.1 MAG: hypothetical protein COW90_05825 [Nitrospirae bacterium CG22_combo_CG10-13_8_21_14_all_44_11]PIV40153.1 MAG: hypothetical protein COS28_10300 [Nitrospirae bacterium CG02_land_8_20_14_3_00_44_33]PIV65539.1 MAG: hypothetical protein COS10_10815 [Nitrospirae bacterium CG01_land_8_20_14_3_00_44_22]PIW88742.1 MAG: hypothetical protein COZ93_08715 [Nitrospirae bacterium CG_4_8_14_3_um_filter_44_28]PIX87672.1 MAG: hypothetical protein CO